MYVKINFSLSSGYAMKLNGHKTWPNKIKQRLNCSWSKLQNRLWIYVLAYKLIKHNITKTLKKICEMQFIAICYLYSRQLSL